MQAPDIGNLHASITAVGSRVTCVPAPLHTDQDWLVRVPEEKFNDFAYALMANGWTLGGSLVPAGVNWIPESQRFNSFTKDEHNIIATSSDEFERKFLAATHVAKRLNLLLKDDRIALFQAVLYANEYTALMSVPFPEPEEIF